MNSGSLADRSVIHKIQGAWRISTLDSSTQYSAMNTGIWIMMGRQPPMRVDLLLAVDAHHLLLHLLRVCP